MVPKEIENFFFKIYLKIFKFVLVILTYSIESNLPIFRIVQTAEEQKRTEALGEKLFSLLKDRPRHRALLTNECKLNHTFTTSTNFIINSVDMNNNPSNRAASPILALTPPPSQTSASQSQQASIVTLPPGLSTNQEDETFYTRELIHIYGQPIVPSFHKHFNYQLSNTHYGYRTLRRLLNCDILRCFVKITKEEIKMLDRVVEFVQLTSDK
jgi:hypothetical protein